MTLLIFMFWTFFESAWRGWYYFILLIFIVENWLVLKKFDFLPLRSYLFQQAIGITAKMLALSVGFYPTIFMIIVRWSVLLESLFFGKFRLTSCANIIFGNVFCAARRFISFLDWTSLSYIWVIKQHFDDCVEIIVNIILLYGSGCLSIWPLIWLVSIRTLQRWLSPLSVFEFVRAFYAKSTLCATS